MKKLAEEAMMTELSSSAFFTTSGGPPSGRKQTSRPKPTDDTFPTAAPQPVKLELADISLVPYEAQTYRFIEGRGRMVARRGLLAD